VCNSLIRFNPNPITGVQLTQLTKGQSRKEFCLTASIDGCVFAQEDTMNANDDLHFTHTHTHTHGYTTHDKIQIRIFWQDWLLTSKKQQGHYRDKRFNDEQEHIHRTFLQINTMLMANFHAVKRLGRRQTVSTILWAKSVSVFNYVSGHVCVCNS
jgi:hypothetical protein